MKYFTIDWWSEGGSGSSEVFTQYADHLEQIRSKLPGSVQRFVEDVSLHDARLTSMRADFATATLTLSLDGYAAPTAPNEWIPLRYSIRYSNVTSLSAQADPEIGLPGPYGFGDLGYDEFHLGANGQVEHHLLFSTGIELVIEFGEIAVEKSLIENAS